MLFLNILYLLHLCRCWRERGGTPYTLIGLLPQSLPPELLLTCAQVTMGPSHWAVTLGRQTPS